MDFPAELKYSKSHEWARVEDGTVTIGITDFAQGELGDVVFVDISANEGDSLGSGDVFGTIEAVKTVSDLYMPVGGTIEAVNENLGDSPEKINSDPYGEGWLIKVKDADLESGEFMDSAAYSEMVGG